jgi:hypothetical protein
VAGVTFLDPERFERVTKRGGGRLILAMNWAESAALEPFVAAVKRRRCTTATRAD